MSEHTMLPINEKRIIELPGRMPGNGVCGVPLARLSRRIRARSYFTFQQSQSLTSSLVGISRQIVNHHPFLSRTSSEQPIRLLECITLSPHRTIRCLLHSTANSTNWIGLN
ncbi:hypothetical protein PHSY_001174 [Pseudozyma hubeiensis SY62]|uniref:Uncharacterized protein n=1 Tax=Pseudozyma hubeiensis (strain SY62) TaxID=1305764 RepID=R9NY58_PSEHS|nr:hypothetical protein PHSY_001174 [Pseudozyma hubeiensis SY62]GAC93609.1 hypothetical protein PHSY_001174 [Pseudozyma hubeiensis SY62]